MSDSRTVMPLAVTPKDGFQMIAVSKSKGWELIAARELDTFKIGRATRITTASIEAFVSRQLQQMAA